MHSNTAKTQRSTTSLPWPKPGVPLLHVCGSLDPWFKDTRLCLKNAIRNLAAKITVIVKKGEGHYPLGPEDPKPVVDLLPGMSSDP